jgi:hypothetical protein
MEQQEYRSYYAILPAFIRYHKNLKPMEKIMWSEISALTNATGECTATNAYFAEPYDVSEECVSRWISALKREQLINVKIYTDPGTKRKRRTITLAERPHDLLINQPGDLFDQNVKGSLDQKVNSINTSNNTTSSKKIDKRKREFEAELEATKSNPDLNIPVMMEFLEYRKTDKKKPINTARMLRRLVTELTRHSYRTQEAIANNAMDLGWLLPYPPSSGGSHSGRTRSAIGQVIDAGREQ